MHRGVSDAAADDADVATEISLRPERLDEFVGHANHRANLRVFIDAARKRREPLDHVILCGPPGLGKTTLAHILAHEMGVTLHSTSGPAIEHKGVLAGLLTKLGPRDVLFIDEIHRLNPAVEEHLYPAMEDGFIDLVTGDGPHATTLKLPLKPFTLVGATTRTGLITSPLRTRFGIEVRLDYYPAEDLATIVRRSARLLGVELSQDASAELGRRSRGTPRLANRYLARARDFAQVLHDGRITREVADEALGRLGVDDQGLDEMDRKYLRCIADSHDGGPVGIETLAAVLGEPRDTLEDVYEPFLLQGGWIQKTPRGRVSTPRVLEHLKIPPRKGGQKAMF
ncbi:MAG: Holliday junction branch migration DNA helicase RuvB [Deltaproteobacteria bacterium]|nr:Holliday junction branch migration DNA helicase RuvB [Deltaproteobacteria bacterium]